MKKSKNSAMRSQELFTYMSREHGLTLTESEMHEIELIVARMLAKDRVQETARPGWWVYQPSREFNEGGWERYAGPFDKEAEAREWHELQPNKHHLRVGREVIEWEAAHSQTERAK